MERITTDEVIEAFARTGLYPKRGIYVQDSVGAVCACGLGAFYLNSQNLTNDILKQQFQDRNYHNAADITEAFDEKYGPNYRVGFIHGFDGVSNHSEGNKYPEYQNDYYKAGYEDGSAAWEAVQEILSNWGNTNEAYQAG